MTVPPPLPPSTPPPPPGHGQQYWSGPPPQQPYGYLPPPPPTNPLAIAALIGAIVVAPVGIVLGHISLSQIKRTGEQGRGLALAGLIIGYVFTAVAVLSLIALIVFAGIFASAVNDSTSGSYPDSYGYDYGTEPAYEDTAPAYDDSEVTAGVIRDAQVGDCLEVIEGASFDDGTSSSTVYAVSCGSSRATHRVTSRESDTASCPLDWVSTDGPVVVLCLTQP